MTDTDYMRGLREASVIVSNESGRRREAGEVQAMYALNTAWHAILNKIDEEEAKEREKQPPWTRSP